MKEKIEKLIEKRISLDEDDDFAIEELWKEEVQILVEDINKTIQYILNEVSDENLAWIGEVFYEVVEKTQSKEFIEAVKNRSNLVKNIETKNDIVLDINFAEQYLK